MAKFKPALGDDTTGMIGEIRQRLLTNVSGNTDPGTADATAITRRLNYRMNYWAAKMARNHGFVGLPFNTDSFSLTLGVKTRALPADLMTIWQVYKIDQNSHELPVTMISPKDSWKYTNRDVRLQDTNVSYKYRGYILDDTLHLVSAVTNDQSLVGDYKIEYYGYPDALVDAADETPFPAQFDEILVMDVVSQLAREGGAADYAERMDATVRGLWREFQELFVKKDRVTNRRIKDSMGYRQQGWPYFRRY